MSSRSHTVLCCPLNYIIAHEEMVWEKTSVPTSGVELKNWTHVTPGWFKPGERPRSVIVLICTLNVFQNYESVAEQLPRINKELRLNSTPVF